MALLHGTCRLWPDATSQIAVAHVEHGLREEQSRADAEFVQSTAQRLGLTCRLLHCDVPAQVTSNGGSTEEVARHLRYQLLHRTALEMNLTTVVCGHHQDDQAETILHNILRGTGLRGLGGMLWRRDLGDGVHLIRPLLNINRESTQAFLHDLKLEWRTDDSNAATEYTRNRIRRDLMPLLAEEYNPQVAASLVRLGQHARDAESLAGQVAQRCLDDVTLELQPGVCRLQRERLREWPVSVVRAALRLIWDQQSWPQQGMTQAHWNQLATELQDADGPTSDVPGVKLSTTPTIVRVFRSA